MLNSAEAGARKRELQLPKNNTVRKQAQTKPAIF
jgi:hypothetical protein